MSSNAFIVPSVITSFGMYGFEKLNNESVETPGTERFAVIVANGEVSFSFKNDVQK